jgi:NAD(P)-dependent dehydrogenase (short-subunit alcohol dehydrogenase family)
MKQAVAIVTGASQGIGYSTAARLARDFSSIVLFVISSSIRIASRPVHRRNHRQSAEPTAHGRSERAQLRDPLFRLGRGVPRQLGS